MQFASKWFLLTVPIALLIVIFGAGNFFVSNKLLNDAIAECEQDKAAKAKQPQEQKEPWKDYDALAKEFGGKDIDNNRSHQGDRAFNPDAYLAERSKSAPIVEGRQLLFDDLIPNCNQAIQIRIDENESGARASTFFGYVFTALFILFIGAIPHIWYFFLRRLSEIAEALRGKR